MIRLRAEENALLLWDRGNAGTAYVSGEELGALEAWARSGRESGFIKRLKKLGVLSDGVRKDILAAIAEVKQKKAPLRSFCAPESLHIELTSGCPLRCAQCYRALGDPVDLPLSTFKDIIEQAADMKVFQIALGGGEPMAYPYLLEAVEEIIRQGMSCSITTSGTGLDRKALARLIESGLDHVQISLNGSTSQIHSLSRDGFESGMEALRLLANSGLSYGVNWVARMDNIDDLPDMIALAKELGVGNINILRYKPSPTEEYDKVRLSNEKFQALREIIRGTKGIVVKVDSAFSNLLCVLNARAGAFGGCGAGRRFVALDAHGQFRPCSHIDLSEPAQNLAAYWAQSAHLAMFREVEDKLSEPCSNCSFLKGCRGCRAITSKSHDFFAGDKECCFA